APAVPADKQYSVLVPVTGPAVLVAAVETPAAELAFPAPPPIDNPQLPPPEVTQVNGLKAVVARKGDTPDILALVAGMDTKRFRALNDLSDRDGVVEGRPYYLQKKRNRAVAEYHVAQPGETVVQVSQQYGVKAKMVLKKNRMTVSELLQPGRLLWLQHTRPADVPVEFMSVAPVAPTVASASATSALPPAAAETAPETATDTVDTDEPATGSLLATASPETIRTISEGVKTVSPPSAAANSPVQSLREGVEVRSGVTAPTASPAVPASPSPAGSSATASTPSETPSGTPATLTPSLAPPQSATAAPTAAPSPAAPAAPSSAGTHMVGKGETLSALSRRYGVTVKDLMTWNSMASPNLRLGQILRVSAPAAGAVPPAPLPPPVPPTTDEAGITRHTVAAGESLYRLSKQYNVTVQQLMEWNSLPDFNVKLGQQLIVGKK
ncbi:MAG: LysM peptidoglycan-binding domain-containing protein, partial [Hymenobacteraceae bacterium]|nr:LysM peptidoglycan-binding domain-containing protein [Hymenobacteraceae bacterium]